MNPTDRVAVVTGATSRRGIGYATAVRLAQAGHTVHITGTTAAVLETAAGLRAEGFDVQGLVCDLTDETEVEALFAALPALDVLVNNAGMTSAASDAVTTGEMRDAQSLTYDGWRTSLARNLDTAFLASKYALPLLRQSRAGRIVVVSSVTGAVMAMRQDAGYAAAKAALVGLARSMALDFARDGITVNAVAPGWITTASQTAAEAEHGLHTPIGRSGTADEVAAVIAFLCSADASYITGQCLVVDGGNSIMEER